MNDPVFITIGWSALVTISLWAVGRWVLPFFHIADTGMEARNLDLQKQLASLQAQLAECARRLAESERKNLELEQRQDFLLGELEKANQKSGRQQQQIAELERQVDALKRGEVPAPEKTPALIVAIGDDAALQLDLASLRAVRTATGMEFQRIESATLDKLKQFINRERMASRKFNVHLAVHAGPQGIRLGGQIIDSIALSEIFDGCGVLLIAGCESDTVGDFLGVIPYVVTMSETVGHDDAALFCRAFWTAIGKHIAPGPALREALNRAPSGMREYVVAHWAVILVCMFFFSRLWSVS
jgi:hypothetical protein